MAKKHRSPSYPAIDLEAAVKLAIRLYPSAKHPLGAAVVAEQWGYKGMNSASPYLAALKHYGLLSEEPGNGDRMLRLTEWALDIAVDREGTTDQRKNALKNAAIEPSLHRELWEKWGGDLPPDSEIRRYLERERGFNPKYVAKFIEQFKETLAFSKLVGDDKIETNDGKQSNQTQLDKKKNLSLGDFVQLTKNGIDRFDRPQKVVGFDASGNWVYVEGCRDGLPLEELTVHESEYPPEGVTMHPPQNPHFPPPPWEDERNSANERMTLDEGPVILNWPGELSAESVHELEDWLGIVVRRMKRKAGIAPVVKSQSQIGEPSPNT